MSLSLWFRFSRLSFYDLTYLLFHITPCNDKWLIYYVWYNFMKQTVFKFFLDYLLIMYKFIYLFTYLSLTPYLYLFFISGFDRYRSSVVRWWGTYGIIEQYLRCKSTFTKGRRIQNRRYFIYFIFIYFILLYLFHFYYSILFVYWVIYGWR